MNNQTDDTRRRYDNSSYLESITIDGKVIPNQDVEILTDSEIEELAEITNEDLLIVENMLVDNPFLLSLFLADIEG